MSSSRTVADTVSCAQAAEPVADPGQHARDYEQVRAIIAHISQNWRDQPDLERIAARSRPLAGAGAKACSGAGPG